MRLYDDQPSGTLSQLRELRRNAPEPEKRLLRGLREAFPNLKWRHQAPVGPFRADLLCFAEQLVIEVDGDTHAAKADYDANRTRYIASQGFRVLRVANNDVMQNLEGVLEHISLSLREREGGPQGRKGEGDGRSRMTVDGTYSPSPRAATRLAPLPVGEGR